MIISGFHLGVGLGIRTDRPTPASVISYSRLYANGDVTSYSDAYVTLNYSKITPNNIVLFSYNNLVFKANEDGSVFARSLTLKDKNNVENFKVASNGYVYARQIEVKGSGNFPDYVFNEEYDLMALQDLEMYIQKNKHLPEVPSAVEVDEKGINLGQMDEILLKKIEELTLGGF